MTSVTSGGGQLPPPDPSVSSIPPKSFIDAINTINTSHSSSASIPVKPLSLHRGEPAVFFSKDEVEAMAKPFTLSLIGKFSFGRPQMEAIRKFFISLGMKGNSQVSLLDQRHVLINLSLEEDYTRLWLRQSWYINGRSMRMFKWTTSFRCSEESPIVPVWISLPFLPIHFVNYKQALHSIAAAVGKPLRVDHATATGNRPSVARVLVEYDISQTLLPRVWIGEGDEGFWLNIILEKVPLYCQSCKHLGHDPVSCYISNPDLRVPWRSNKSGQVSNTTKRATDASQGAKDPLSSSMPLAQAPSIGSGSPTNSPCEPRGRGTQISECNVVHEETLHENDGDHADGHVNIVSINEDVEKSCKDAEVTDTMEGAAGVRSATSQMDNVTPHTHAMIPTDISILGENGSGGDKFTGAIIDVDASSTILGQPSDVMTLANNVTSGVDAHDDDRMEAWVQHTQVSLLELPCNNTSSSPIPREEGTELQSQGQACMPSRVAPTQLQTLRSSEAHARMPPTSSSQREQPREEAPKNRPCEPNFPPPAAMPDVGLEDFEIGLQNFASQPVEEETALPHPESTLQVCMAQHSKAHEEVVLALDSSLGHQPNFQPISPSNSAQQTKVHEDIVQGLDSNLSHQPIYSAQVELTKAPDQALTLQPGQEPISALHKAKPTVATADETHSAQTKNALSKEVPGPIGTNGSSSSSAPNSFSFQAGQRIEFNPNPTVVVVDSLPMPRPIYNSEDYITDGTVDESDSFYMPDYSHVSFNTHSSIIPDDTYYGPISRSHSLDDRELCDEEMGIDARCGVSDSAIGFTKVTPRKSRQYHLRPRNRRR